MLVQDSPILHLNALSHSLHLNGRSSECDLLWTRRLLAVEKLFPQVGLFFLVKPFPQTSHMKGFTCACDTSWYLSAPAEVKVRSQTPHFNGAFCSR
uniref:Uncharacterized protein n=1 Tax=Sparus aurata TaxID=8175 RepID=A0A671TG37_SPAAU